MSKQIWPIAKMNLKNIKVPYFVAGLVFLTTFVEAIIFTIVALVRDESGSQLSISSGNYTWLLVLLAAIFILATNLRKIINLGGKRSGFFWGSMTAYTVLAGAASLVNTIYYYTVEPLFISTGYYVSFEAFMRDTSLIESNYINVNLVELFGWSANGIIFVFVQQFVFLLLVAAVTHTLTSMQDKWYGWAADILIAAILAVFIPISTLRPALLGFLNLIIFNSNALIQIFTCLILSTLIYACSKPVLSRKVI